VNRGPNFEKSAFPFRFSLVLSVFLCFTTLPAQSAELPLEGVLDLEGHAVKSVSPQDNRKAIVFLFMSVDCPVCNRYAPALRKLKTEFQDARFILVYPNRDETSDTIRTALKEYDLTFETWRDTQHTLVRAAQARVTPDAAVYLIGKGWVYRGRIDDRYTDWGKQRSEAKVHDLRNVLAAISKGDIPISRTTKAIGCSIPKLPE
jgi:peroxiredoxin